MSICSNDMNKSINLFGYVVGFESEKEQCMLRDMIWKIVVI